MKLSILTLVILLSTFTSFCQDSTKASTEFSSLMKKSKNQKTAAWICLGAGATLTTVAVIVGLGELANGFNNFWTGETTSSYTSDYFFYSGLAGMVASIPLFIISSSTRRKAEALNASIKWRNITEPGLYVSKVKSYPSLTVTIRF